MRGREIKLLVLLMALAIGSAHATDIPGGTVNGIWNVAGSPYNVLGDITILAGENLLIEAGCVVNFAGAYELTIQGVLQAIGTDTDSVRIEGSVTWDGLRFENETLPSMLTYCRIDGADTGVNSINAPLPIFLGVCYSPACFRAKFFTVLLSQTPRFVIF